MNFNVIIVKDIPEKKIKQFEDKVVYGIARETLDMTSGHFPRLTGDLERGSYAMGVVNMGNMTYGLGSTVDYAKYPWKWTINDNINWTNPNTIPKWYGNVYLNNREKINAMAVSKARSIL